MKFLFMMAATIFFIGVCLLAPCQGNDFQARIVLDSQGGHVTIKPLCYAPENAMIQYKLWVKKDGRSGKSTSYQSGSVRLLGGEEKCLAQCRLAISPEDQYQIKLEVYKEGNLIAEDQVSHP
jgi:hypothetical protein